MEGKIDYSTVPGYRPSHDRRCRYCRKALPPNVEWEELPDDATGDNVVKVHHRMKRPVRIVGYGYGTEGLFCTLTCGYEFACGAIALSRRPPA